MDFKSFIVGSAVFLVGFIISEIKNYIEEKRKFRIENRRIFYDQITNLINRLIDDDSEEYYKFFGIDKKILTKNGNTLKMAAYLSQIIDTYHNLHKHNLNFLLKNDYSLFNKIMANKISQDYWTSVVREKFFGDQQHEIVLIVDELVKRYQKDE